MAFEQVDKQLLRRPAKAYFPGGTWGKFMLAAVIAAGIYGHFIGFGRNVHCDICGKATSTYYDVGLNWHTRLIIMDSAVKPESPYAQDHYQICPDCTGKLVDKISAMRSESNGD